MEGHHLINYDVSNINLYLGKQTGGGVQDWGQLHIVCNSVAHSIVMYWCLPGYQDPKNLNLRMVLTVMSRSCTLNAIRLHVSSEGFHFTGVCFQWNSPQLLLVGSKIACTDNEIFMTYCSITLASFPGLHAQLCSMKSLQYKKRGEGLEGFITWFMPRLMSRTVASHDRSSSNRTRRTN